MFKPYMKGYVWFCEQHFPAITHVRGLKNEYRVLREMEHKVRQQDPNQVKRNCAILAAYAKHQGKKDYIKEICQDLQKQKRRVKMPQKWLDAWERAGFRVEASNWFDALQNREVRSQIQKYISKRCKPKLRASI